MAKRKTEPADSEHATVSESVHKYDIQQPEEQQQQQTQPLPEAPEIPDPARTMLKEEYDYALQQEIRKGTAKIEERFVRLVSQEKNLMDRQYDALGNSSDDYERIAKAIRSDNLLALGESTEEVYRMLYDLDFTGMRPIEAIKQQYRQD